MQQVHGEDLARDVLVRVGKHAVSPVVRDTLGGEAPRAVRFLLGAEEGRDGLEVGRVAARARRHQLVQEAGGAEEQQAQRAEVEVLVLRQALVVPLLAVECQVLTVEVALARIGHHAEEGSVEVVVVAAREEVVVAGERSVGLELVVSVQPRLAAGQQRRD